MSCFQMDLLSEAEAVLLPTREPDAELDMLVLQPSYVSMFFSRYTSRNEKSVKHLRKALFIDLLFWPAYKELCTLGLAVYFLGAAEETNVVFSEAAYSYAQECHLCDGSSYSQTACEDKNSGRVGPFLEDRNLRHLRHLQEHNLRDFSENIHEAAVFAEPSGDPIQYSVTSA
ncbi:hypothetical protein GH714_020568 [Hevea brasiliensis]|uniref:Uncharacterized protein n=1 Tax=Hevea brasiliensis TaxID=3981 RepID=A0A6A6LJI1_HEVBR|nr:hypothetical protein GH714_020515 [Hevea brasiliensis]KAF2301164.1 hypothetical protein GH714_020568 [Hevea brasiliensis]